MSKRAKELSALAVSKIKNDGLHAVGGIPGLYIQITENSRSWIFRFYIGTRTTSNGKTVAHLRDMGLGAYPEVTLAEARATARELRQQIRNGIDPIEERRAAKARAKLESVKTKTFQECAEAFIVANRTGWKNAKHAQQWGNTLSMYAYPVIGGLPVAEIDTGLVLEVLQQPVQTKDGTEALWNAKTETASRVRNRIENILDWAKVHGLREGDNPADWTTLKYTLPAKSKVQKVKHFTALPYSEMGVFMADLRKREGMAARALEFAILTAARSGEVRGATWYEIDLTAKIWTIPADRMKADKEHFVPLSAVAIRLLESLPRDKGNDYVFPAQKGGAMSDMALTMVLRRMKRGDIKTHGFRSTFRDWAGETTNYPREVIEHALSHQLKDKAEAAYARGALIEKRKGLMTDWAKYCDKIPIAESKNNVVSIRRAG